jgi:hypothetical protein
MKIYIESEACLVKRCNAARGSPSAPPSFGAGPTVLTAARASPFRGFSNSTYTKSPKSHTNGHIAGSERLNSKSSSYSPRRSSSPQPRPAEERHITQIRGTPLLTTNLVKATVGKEAPGKGCSRGRRHDRRGRQRRWRGRRRARPTSRRPWRRPPASRGPRRLQPGGNGWSQCYVAARREDEGAGGGGEGKKGKCSWLPLTRPRISVVRARSGGQPGLSTTVVRGILSSASLRLAGGVEKRVGEQGLVFF